MYMILFLRFGILEYFKCHCKFLNDIVYRNQLTTVLEYLFCVLLLTCLILAFWDYVSHIYLSVNNHSYALCNVFIVPVIYL